jgi:hypothetical protein
MKWKMARMMLQLMPVSLHESSICSSRPRYVSAHLINWPFEQLDAGLMQFLAHPINDSIHGADVFLPGPRTARHNRFVLM